MDNKFIREMILKNKCIETSTSTTNDDDVVFFWKNL